MDIRAIIISPTRELAEQIAVEAKKVTRNTGVIVQTAVGGSRKQEGLRKIKYEGCHILVGTPGRLKDILEDPYSQVRAPNLSAFVLDEADRLLDQGFAPEIQAIQRLLPDRSTVDRQTLLFSATIPQELMQIVRHTMKRDFKFVRTVREGAQETHEKVPQKVVNVGGFENVIPAVLELCKREIENNPSFKAIIYFNATADVTLASQMFANLRNPGQSLFHQHPLHPAKQFSIHARLTQQGRTRAADSFRRADSAILFSSDVTARGMDFPNVTHVIQVGVPSSRDTYIHRIGRTARGDKEGEGWIFLTNLEVQENSMRLRKLPLKPDTSLETAKVDMTKDAQLPEDTAKILTQVVDAAKMAPRGDKVASYLATLGVYGWVADKQQLIDAMNNRAKYLWAMDPPPAVGRGLVQKLGLSRLRGVNIGHEERDGSESLSRGSYGNSSGGYAVGGGRGDRSSYGSSDRGGGFGGSRSSYGGSDRGGGFGGSRSSYGGSDRGGGLDGSRSSYGGSDRGGGFGGSRSSYGGSDRGGGLDGSRSSYGSSDRGGGFGGSRSSYGGSDRGDSYVGGRGSGSSRGRGGFGRTNDRTDSRRSDYSGYSREGRGGGSDRSLRNPRDGGRGGPSYERKPYERRE